MGNTDMMNTEMKKTDLKNIDMSSIDLERIPLNGTFELTARCNLKCKMCLIRIDNKRMEELGGRERTTEEWIHMAQEVQEAGTIGLLLTGGEPMLRPDFVKIYRAVAQMGFMLTLYTNATLVTPEIMDVLREYPPHRIGITTYGASPETYEKVTGSADAYVNMLEGMELLRMLPSKLTIRTTLIKDSLEDLDKITQWAMAFGENVNFNVSRIVTKPVRGGISDVASCRLTPEQNVAMLRQRNEDLIIKPFHDYIKDNTKKTVDHRKLVTIPEDKSEVSKEVCKAPEKKRTLYGCEAGMNSYTITWDGKLIGCQMLGDCWTNPFDEGFLSAWESFPDKVKLPPYPRQCIECNITCNACPATRLAETGYLGGLPEYLCTESKLTKQMEEELVTEFYQMVKKKGREDNEKLRIS